MDFRDQTRPASGRRKTLNVGWPALYTGRKTKVNFGNYIILMEECYEEINIAAAATGCLWHAGGG